MASAPIGHPTGAARIAVAAKPKPVAEDASEEDKQLAAHNALGATATVVSLYSYDGDGAERAFRSLEDAGLPCEKGFVATVEGEQLGPGSRRGPGREARLTVRPARPSA